MVSTKMVRIIKGKSSGMTGRYIGDQIENNEVKAIVEMEYMYDVTFPYDYIEFIEE